MLPVDLCLKFYSEFAARKLLPRHAVNHSLFNCFTRTKVSQSLLYVCLPCQRGGGGRRAVLNVLNEILETKH